MLKSTLLLSTSISQFTLNLQEKIAAKRRLIKKILKMFSSRSRKALSSAINSPTTVYVRSSQTLSNDGAEHFLNDFITTSESIPNSITGIASSDSEKTHLSLAQPILGNAAIPSQLKRMQRSLRGLPPVISEVAHTIGSDNAEKKSPDVPQETPRKKIKFDDAEENILGEKTNDLIVDTSGSNESPKTVSGHINLKETSDDESSVAQDTNDQDLIDKREHDKKEHLEDKEKIEKKEKKKKEKRERKEKKGKKEKKD